MKNWNVKEAVEVINAGTDKEAINEIVKHYPQFAIIAARKDFNSLCAVLPDAVTVRKVEALCNNTEKADDVEETVEEPEETKTEVEEPEEEIKAEEETEEEADETNLEDLPTKELVKLCKKRGIKVPEKGRNKQFYIDKLKAAEADSDEDEVEEDEEEDVESAIDLFKKCKKAGLKVPKGKDAKFYQSKLDELEEGDDDDDWDDDEEEEVEEPKETKKADKTVKKSKKVEEPEEDEDDDDDDDWDI